LNTEKRKIISAFLDNSIKEAVQSWATFAFTEICALKDECPDTILTTKFSINSFLTRYVMILESPVGHETS